MSPTAAIRHHHVPDRREMVQEIADQILQIADSSITARGTFRLALTGGRSAERLYKQLRQSADHLEGWEFWFGDERYLPEDHPQRNSLMAGQLLFDGRPPEPFHPVPFEATLEHSVRSYQQRLNSNKALPFDLVLLSLGEDGHIASLFPDHPYNSQEMVVAVTNAPKEPPSRISLTATALSSCRNMIIMATGEEKRDALSAWSNGADLPVARLNPACGIDLFTDQT